MRKFIKNSDIALSAFAVALMVILFFPRMANAGFLDNILNPVDFVAQILSVLVDFVGYALITLAASIVNFVFSFQKFVEVQIVQIGWTLVRDMANMVFILIMLAVAFSTILQFETYGWKKIIPKLVVAALTINFSLLICGIIIDFGNSISMFFISGGTPGGPAEVGTNIMSAVRAGAIAQLRNSVSAPGTAMLAAVAMQLIFYIALAFVLFAIGVIMLWRMLSLWILIIISPAAWVGSIISPGSFKKWWSKFINLAVVFPIAMSFFVFLSLVIGTTFQSPDNTDLFSGLGTAESVWTVIFPETGFTVVMQFLVVISFLGYGLSFAQKTGTAGGAMMVKWAGKGKDWAMGKLKAAPIKVPLGAAKFGARTAERVGDRFTHGGVTRKFAEWREGLEKRAVIGRALGGPGTRFAAQQKALGASADKTKGLRPNDIKARLKQAAITPEGLQNRAGMIKNLIDKGQFDLDLDPNFEKSWLRMVQTFQNNGGNMTDLIKTAPDLAYNPEIQKMISRDVNAPSPVKKKWQDVSDEKDAGKQDEAIKKTIGEDIIKTAADFAKIRKESLDMKGKLSKDDSDQYDRAETDKESLRKILSLQEEIVKGKSTNKDTTDLENELSKLKNSLDGTNSALTDLKKAADISRKDYLTAVKKLQEQQITLSKRESQVKIAELFLNQLKKDGRLYAGSLNDMASKNRDAHLNLLKYLKANMATMQEGDFNKGVYEHVFGGLVSNTMVQAAPATP